jgi:hypothetical protein
MAASVLNKSLFDPLCARPTAALLSRRLNRTFKSLLHTTAFLYAETVLRMRESRLPDLISPALLTRHIGSRTGCAGDVATK